MLEKISRMKNRISWYLGETKKGSTVWTVLPFFSLDVFSYSLCGSLWVSPGQEP